MRQLGDLAGRGRRGRERARPVLDVRVEPGFRRRIQRTIAVLRDDTGTVEATWFGRRYIERRLFPAREIIVSGKLKHFGRKLTIDNPDFQPVGRDDELLHVGRIVPVYRLTAGLTAARLRIAMREALDRAGDHYPEYLPASIRTDVDVVGIADARRRRTTRRRSRVGTAPAQARLRRAAGAPARHGRAAPTARTGRGGAAGGR